MWSPRTMASRRSRPSGKTTSHAVSWTVRCQVRHSLIHARAQRPPTLAAIVLDGFQATKRIRELEESGELPDHLPVIALTANVTQESEGDCKAAGMDHFLPKPLKMAGMSPNL